MLRLTQPTQAFVIALLLQPLGMGVALTGCAGGATSAASSGGAGQTQGAASAAGSGNTPSAAPSAAAAVGASCGFNNTGTRLHVAPGIDVCLPKVACTPEVCPDALGRCVAGACVPTAGYKGLQTLPEAWATHYCTLSNGSCNGVTQIHSTQETAAKLGALMQAPLCEGAPEGKACIGIAASSPMLVGNSQNTVDAASGAPVRPWGVGLSEASNVCYRLTGKGGEAYVALTDRCGGYCKCQGSGYGECSSCVNARDLTPNCPCVGTLPGVAEQCCGAGPGCGAAVATCDWCASNNHPHFDLDDATFNHLCGADAVRGSCKLTGVEPIACPLGVSWPPP